MYSNENSPSSSQLGGTSPSAIPSTDDIANLAVRLARKYIDLLGDVRGRVPAFQGAVFGWCPVRQTFQLLHFQPRSSDDPTMIMDSFNLKENGSVFLMGNHIFEIKAAIDNKRQGLSGIAWDNAPKDVIKESIRNESYKSIGVVFKGAYAYLPNSIFLQ